MSAHTKGPWAQHPQYPWIIKEDSRPIGDIEDGVTICSTTSHDSSGFFPCPGEGVANARLISAAPELLEALQAWLDSDKADQFAIAGRDQFGHPLSAQGVARMKARAAILKATGEQA